MRYPFLVAGLVGILALTPAWADDTTASTTEPAAAAESESATEPAAATEPASVTEPESATEPASVIEPAGDVPGEIKLKEEQEAPADIKSPEAKTGRTGFSTSVGMALATCLPNGSADCTNTYPGASGTSAIEARFWYVGIALEFDYGFHVVGGAGSENVSSTTMHITPMLKGYYPMEPWEFFLGAGLGYSSITVSEDVSESLAGWSTIWQGVKLSGGAWYDLYPHGMPEGFTLDLAASLFLNYGGTRCTEYAGSGPCLSGPDLDPSQRDVARHIQLSTALRYTF